MIDFQYYIFETYVIGVRPGHSELAFEPENKQEVLKGKRIRERLQFRHNFR